MRHEIDEELWSTRLGPELAPRLGAMTEAIERCVHCGFCLATCPTYRTMGEEMDSPRGRIVLAKELLEERLELDDVLEHIDPCLGCLACESSCPSGVEYRNLLQPLRTYGERQRRRRPLIERWRRRGLLELMQRPAAFRWALRAAALARPLRRVLPSALRPALHLVPAALPRAQPLPNVSPALGERRARVALLRGCVQQVLDPDVSRAAIDVLTRNGVEVLVPPAQGCCGALAMHVGEEQRARGLARRNLAALRAEVDAVVSCAAGCGSALQELPALFAGASPEEQGAAQQLAARALDITAFLQELGLAVPPPAWMGANPLRVALHEPCHLRHAQQVRTAPAALLSQVEGLQLLTPRDPEVCCGSAGLYSLEHPQTADELGRRKAENLHRLRPDVIASGNIGCSTQIERWMRAMGGGSMPPVRHPVQILRDAYAQAPQSRFASAVPPGSE